MNESDPYRSPLDDDMAIVDVEDQRLDELAFEMRMNGATKGMIVRRLVEESASQAKAQTIARRALRRDHNRQRLQGAAIALSGAVVLVIGLAAIPAFLRLTIPLSIVFLGLIVFGIGAVQALGKGAS